MTQLEAANDLANTQLVLAQLAEYGAVEVRRARVNAAGYEINLRHVASSEPLSPAVLDAWIEEINSALVATYESMVEKFEVRRLEHYAKVTS
jgi:hypothetical protein